MKAGAFFLLLLLIPLFLVCGCIAASGPAVANENIKNTPTTFAQKTTTTIDNPFIYLRFAENSSGCSLEGNLSLDNSSLGHAQAGTYRMNYSEFSQYADSLHELCLNGSISGCQGYENGWKISECWQIKIPKGFFFYNSGKSVNFTSFVDFHHPKNYEEVRNFIRPGDVSAFIEHQREIGFFDNNTVDDIETIWKYVDLHISYRYDSDTFGRDYWELPNETMLGWGDCEDFTNLFVSLARAYESSVKCYSLRLPSHLGAFCKLDTVHGKIYGFFDQNTHVKGFFTPGQDESSKIRETLNLYFAEYQIENQEQHVLFGFDENRTYVFNTNEDFIEWAKSI